MNETREQGIALKEVNEGKLLEVEMTGKLTSKDYERLVPEVDRLVHKHGKVRILVEMHDFRGWTVGGLWQDIKFDLKHFGDIERLAMVGEKPWQHGMAVFCKPFTGAKIQYFEHKDAEQARAWLASAQA